MNKTVITLALALASTATLAAPGNTDDVLAMATDHLAGFAKKECPAGSVEQRAMRSGSNKLESIDAVPVPSRDRVFAAIYGCKEQSRIISYSVTIVENPQQIIIGAGDNGGGNSNAVVGLARGFWADLEKAGCKMNWNAASENKHTISCGPYTAETYAFWGGKTRELLATGKLAAAAATVKDVLPNPLTLPEKLGQALKSWGL